MAPTRKRVRALPADLQYENSRRKSAKELHVGFLPGSPEKSGKRRPSSLPFDTGAVLPLAAGTPAVLPDPVPPPWARSAASTTAGPSRDTSNDAAVAGPSLLLSPVGPSHSDLLPEGGSSWVDDMLHLPQVLNASPSRITCVTPPPYVGIENEESPLLRTPASKDSSIGDEDKNGSDVDAEDREAEGDNEPLVRPPTLATDSPAVLPENIDPRLTNLIDQMDRQSDSAIRSILPSDRIVFDWRSDLNSFTGVREKFTGTPGPTFSMSEIDSPVNVFLKIWDQEIMSLIVKETNDYAAQCLDTPNLKASSRIRRWHPTTMHELYIFFVLMIQQSLFPATVEHEYFYPVSRMTAMPFFKEYISYNRLVLLKKFIHFSNNNNMSDSLSLEERRIYKIQPIINHLNRKFQGLYLPKQNIAIDESLLKWHGHLSFVQKIATKAAKTGIKSYELCESDTGYLWKFSIYAGKDATADKLNREDQPKKPDQTDQTDQTDQLDETDRPDWSDPSAGAIAKIVYDLANHLFEKGYTIIMDNFYNSPLLARSLKLRRTDCYGTMRLNRENVPESLKSLTKLQLTTGDVVSSTCGDLNVIAWKDASLVTMVSTYHKVEVGAAEKHGRWKFKPQVVLDYNKAMGGVDKKDQMLANYPLERTRNSIWYKKLFRRLLNASVLNAFIIYKCKNNSITHRNFRLQVIEGLLKMFFQHSVVPRTPTSIQATRQLPSTIRGQKPRTILKGNHFAVKITEHPLKKTCVWCSENGKRSRTTWECDVCTVALCVECMKPYHTQVRIKKE